MNIPLYRAKKIDRDGYVEGYLLCQKETRERIELCQILDSAERVAYDIDKSTLSIHFPDMLDSEGNKIFASLSEDGKDGDIVTTDNFSFVAIQYTRCHIKYYNGNKTRFTYAPKYLDSYCSQNLKVIGIQK